ncbi:MAG TPA: TRAM domain-containing protein [Candidatus Coatesbacteria bacterium]|nr:TRAM domain-containing protein [Candidatus Coatesbacteria bacterium]
MLLAIRIGIIAFMGGIAGFLTQNLFPETEFAYLIGAAVGVGVAVIFVALEIWLSRRTNRQVIAGAIGLLAGLLAAAVVSSIVIVSDHPGVRYALSLGVVVLFAYMGATLAVRKLPAGWFKRADLPEGDGSSARKVLDTSVIIDGRVADICAAGFLEGTLLVPKFVLKELQLISDSSDPLRRNRGRRGLDILNDMQKKLGDRVQIEPTDFPELSEVDSKLVKLAMTRGAKILTNDFNLNKVAELQGVTVLNINELANALKPVFLSGERMTVKLVKEGTEPGQAVGYLDDGTMVVVDRGRENIGREVEVTVTSHLQTSAGRMIFARLGE